MLDRLPVGWRGRGFTARGGGFTAFKDGAGIQQPDIDEQREHGRKKDDNAHKADELFNHSSSLMALLAIGKRSKQGCIGTVVDGRGDQCHFLNDPEIGVCLDNARNHPAVFLRLNAAGAVDQFSARLE